MALKPSTPKRRAKGRTGRDPVRPTESSVLRDVDKLLQQSRIFDISQDAIFLWRYPGKIEFWNKGAAELYGYPESEALGRISHELLRTEFPEPIEEILEKLKAEGQWRGELGHRTKSGEQIIVSTRLQLVSQGNHGIFVLESTRDITEAKQSQQQLEQRLRKRAVVARFSLDALQATSIQMICDDATQLLAREIGADYSSVFELLRDGKTLLLRSGAGWRSDSIGRTQIKLGEETATGRALQLNQPVIIEDVPADRQLSLPQVMRDHQVVSSMAVVVQGRGRAFGVLGVDTVARRSFSSDDVHFLESIGNVLATAVARLQFEHDLRETAGRLRGIVETAVDGIITIDERGIVETMNPAAERIFGFAADEVMGKNISMLMPEPYHSEHDGYLERYHRTGERRIIGIGREVKGRRKDGSVFPMDLAVSATSLGERRVFTGLVRDITARKELEQEILEISDHEQRRIGSDLHDDLCQQLAGIRFSCDVLKKTLSNGESDDAVERLDKIAAGLSRAIDHTRMLARGMAPVALEKNGLLVALQELSENVCKLFAKKCTFTAKGDVLVKDPIAATHLYRIAQEAINNALKHADASRITVSIKKANGRSVMTIEDNGRGFTPRETHGTAEGMGLRSIAYRAGMIDAAVEVDSKPGRGTRITCTFSAEL